MSTARSNQERARQDLKDLVDAVKNRKRERELSRLVKELKNAEADLKKLRERQAENLKKTQEAQKNANAKERAEQLKRLAKEQQEIQDEMNAPAQTPGKTERRGGCPRRESFARCQDGQRPAGP